MKTAERIAICAIAAALAAPVIAAGTSYNKNIEVTYGLNVTWNGQNVEWIDSNGKVVQPFIYEDTAYVPLKTLAPLLGASSQYQYESNTVDIQTSVVSSYKDKFDELINDTTQEQTGVEYDIGSQKSEFSAKEQAEYERLLKEYDSLMEEYTEMYNVAAQRMQEINAGTATNQDAWQETYNATMQRLMDRIDAVTSQIETFSKIYASRVQAPGANTVQATNNEYVLPLHLYSNDGKVYLGKCTLDQYDKDSIWYPLIGEYSSEYKQNSIWNKYGTYGSDLLSRDESAFNNSAKHPPIIVDNDGKFVGYLTTNTSIDGAWSIYELRRYIEEHEK